jgi:hypothetical protein
VVGLHNCSLPDPLSPGFSTGAIAHMQQHLALT